MKAGFRDNRREALKRDNYSCKLCGTKERLECHHIVPYSISQSHAIGNLATLCQDCHSKVDGKA